MESEHFAGVRMGQTQSPGVQTEPTDAGGLSEGFVLGEVAIHIIADHRCMTRRRLNSNLMGAPRDEVDLDQREPLSAIVSDHPIGEFRVGPGSALHDGADPAFFTLGKQSILPSARRLGTAEEESQVRLLHPALLE